MNRNDLRDAAKQSPFEPFRIVMTDGIGFDIPHPDLLMVGERSAIVGVPKKPGKTYFHQTVKVDMLHVVRIEPLEKSEKGHGNGKH